MILDRLTLENFGLYRGAQAFDLAPAVVDGRHRPIVLFGGMNGGGKTTLLDAIQLALYGPRAKCSKRTNLAYDEFLRRSVHHGIPPGTRAGVTLSFRYALDGREHLYEVRRTWTADGAKVREELRVFRDAAYDGWVTENWPQLVEELFPLDVAQLFFFDAEKIRTLAEDESSSRALAAAIKSLLGLDLVERLIADGTVLQTRLARRSADPAGKEPGEELEERAAAFRAAVERLAGERAALENDRLRAEADARAAEAKFAAGGGKHWEAREARRQRLAELGRQAAECSDELRALAAGELPLALVPDLLGAARGQDARERTVAESEVLARLLGERDEWLLGLLKTAGAAGRVVWAVRKELEADRAARQPGTVARRHALSDAGRDLLGHLLDRSLGTLAGHASALLARLDRVEAEREALERADAATPEQDDIGKLVAELGTASGRLAALDDRARRLDEALAAARAELAEAERVLARHLAARAESKFGRDDDRRMMQLAGRTREVMGEFLRRVTARKIDRLSGLITESFRYLLRKEGLVRRILIDPDTFAIALDDGTGREVSKERLSEGEKQLFAVSVLWGLARAAARPLPAVIDTPMARLDATHRRHLVERYFPHASHQVVIFSTDTEVDRESYRLLQPAVARAYHLNYDEKSRATVGEAGYFWADGDAPERPAKTA